MKILINLMTQSIIWHSNWFSTVNAIEDMKTLDGVSQKEYQQLETEFKTACWAITNLHQKWWPWCERPQSHMVTICPQQTWSHPLLSIRTAPQHARHESLSQVSSSDALGLGVLFVFVFAFVFSEWNLFWNIQMELFKITFMVDRTIYLHRSLSMWNNIWGGGGMCFFFSDS